VRLLVSPRFRIHVVIGVVSLVGGLMSGQPSLVALSAPFLLLIALGLVAAERIDVTVDAKLDKDRAIEGEDVKVLLSMQTTSSAPAHVTIDLPAGLSIHPEQDDPAILATDERGITVRGSHESIELALSCDRWGAYRPPWLRVSMRQGLSQFVETATFPIDLLLRVYPTTEMLRHLLRPVETQLGFGDLVSRRKGAGLEFADLRTYQPGDDFRRINWRVSASGRGTWVNDRHPERNSDVVLLVDTLAGPRQGVAGVLDVAVKAAAAIAAAYLDRHDRVGLVSFGEPVRWIEAGMGDVQRYRILDTLMDSHVRRQLLWRGVRVVPPRALPPQALVIGLTPLLDQRVVDAFGELRGRGFDLTIIEIAPEPFLSPPDTQPTRVARRIWRLEREATRMRFARHGIPLVRWEQGPLQEALAAVERLRRRARIA
jgi:uncharacterized protein (DUF58 family)